MIAKTQWVQCFTTYQDAMMTILLFFVPILVGLIVAAPVVVGAIRKRKLAP